MTKTSLTPLDRVEVLLTALHAYIYMLSETELRHLQSDVADLDNTNCWFFTYASRGMLAQAVDDALAFRRNQQSELSHD